MIVNLPLASSGDNYLIRWLWIETYAPMAGIKCLAWQLPYQVIVDWNYLIRVKCLGQSDNYLIRWLWIETPGYTSANPLAVVTITLSGDCGLKRIHRGGNWAGFRWQLPYQVIVDWNFWINCISCYQSGDNYLIRWLWIETFALQFGMEWSKWQLPYQVIVDWNFKSPNKKNHAIVTITLSGDCGLKRKHQGWNR